MLSVDQAQAQILQHSVRLPIEQIDVSPAALGLVLAHDIAADLDSPPFAKSMVDGYALRSTDVTSEPVTLRIIEEVLAGQMPTKPIVPGQTTRIMTGAPLPPGADAVVMHEKTTLSPDGQTVQIPPPVQPRQNIMAQGEEMKSGQVVLPADTTLRPQELGLLATVGKSTIQVFRRPIVALLSTGDEVVEPGAPLRHGQIRNSNAPMLAAQITRAGSQPHYLGIAPDSPTVLRSCIERGLQSDVLIITGGVSAGKVDLVPDILAELGVTAIFHKVAVKPGKPLLFGVKNHTLIFGLPGNPASCHIGFELFARPALRKLLGRPLPHLPRTTHAILATELPLKSDRQTYLPVQLRSTAQGELATPLPWRGSGDLFTICLAHAFAIFPPSQQTYPANSPIEILLSESDF